jgi:DNA polymerase-4
MPLHRARRLCPQAEILAGDYQIYRCFAEHVWDVCGRYTCGLETYLDEAYGDATGMTPLLGPPPTMGRALQEEIREEVGLPVSVGLAGNRMMAKIASSAAKPGGVAWVEPGREEAFLAELPIRKLPGIGRKTERKLTYMNVNTVAELRRLGRPFLRSLFGRRGDVLYDRSRGLDARDLRQDALPRTISRETTFHEPACEMAHIRAMLFYLLERAMRTARRQKLLARCVEVSIRYDDRGIYEDLSARKTLPEPSDADNEVFATASTLLGRLHKRRVAVRHVGVALSSFVRKGNQLSLFESREHARDRKLNTAVDAIRDRYGHAAVVSGKSVELLGKLEKNDYGFVLRTPSLTK